METKYATANPVWVFAVGRDQEALAENIAVKVHEYIMRKRAEQLELEEQKKARVRKEAKP